MGEWVEGAPPDFKEDTWIVAEIPSRWIENQVRYQCYRWLMPKGWTDKEVLRALRWKLLFGGDSNAAQKTERPAHQEKQKDIRTTSSDDIYT